MGERSTFAGPAMRRAVVGAGAVALSALLVAGCGGSGNSSGGGNIPLVSITTTSLPNASVGAPYSGTVTASGGTGFTWSVVSGNLPPGLTLVSGTPDAQIINTPSVVGTFSFTLQVQDSGGLTATQSFTLTVLDPIAVSPATLPAAQENLPYSQMITGTGGTGNYTWSVSGGSLPPGLTLMSGSPSATLSGTPTTPGMFSFTVQVTDDQGAAGLLAYTLTVDAVPSITTTSLGNGTDGSAYSATVSATGGSGMGYTWTVSSGALPAGLTLTSGTPDATITGTPTGATTANFTLQLVDSGGAMTSQAFTLVIDPVLTITTMTLPNGTMGSTYTQMVTASGGTGSGYTWTVSAGALPGGVTLTSGTPDATLMGMPAMVGTSNFTLQVVDSNNNTATQALSIMVDGPLAITTMTLPDGGQNQPYSQMVSAGGGTGMGYTWTVSAGALPAGLTLTSGTPDATISGTPTVAPATTNFTLQCVDSNMNTATQALSITVNLVPPEIAQPVVPPADINMAYTFTMTGTAGSGTGYTFAVTGGALPTGVTLSPAGLLSGTPTVGGGFYFQVTLTDSLMATVVRDYVLNVRSPERFLAYVGDDVLNNLTEMRLVDVSSATPGAPFSALPTQIAAGDVSTSQAAFHVSPDGRYLAYLVDGNIDNTDDLYVVDLTQPMPTAVRLTNLASARDCEEFEWSPDSRKIAVNADFTRAGDDELAIIDITAGLAMPVFTLVPGVVGGDVQPTGGTTLNDEWVWSADSTKIYFRGDVLVNNTIEAFMFNLNAPMLGAQRLHPPLPSSLRSVSSMGGVGNDIALFTCDLDVDNEINLYAVSTAGGMIGTPVRLNPLVTNGDVGLGTFDVRTAPGGRWVAFVGDLTTDGSDDCYLADFRNGIPAVGSALNVSNLGATTFDVGFDGLYWSPQGDKLCYVADATDDAEEEVFFVDLRGAMPMPAVRISAAVTTFEDTDEVRWAPDGSGVAMEGEFVVNGIEELFYVNLAGPTPGPLIQLSGMRTTASDVEGDVVWLPNSSAVVYRHDAARSGLNEVFIATPPMVMTPTRINTPYPADNGSNFVGVGSTNDMFVTRDSQRVVAAGADVFVDNNSECIMINLPTAPNLTRLNNPVPTSGDVFGCAINAYEPR